LPSVELLAVGTELLLGQLTDTNTAYVAAHLADVGIDVYATHAVGDNRARIAATITAALVRSDGVISTGGLGPTVDDLTKEAACDVLGLPTETDRPTLRSIEERFAARGDAMRENNRKQAEIPRGAHVLINPHGTAPGFIAFDARGKFIACMPGVPREMKPMLAEQLIPFLRERLALPDTITTRVLHTIGLAESEIDHRIGELWQSENPKVAVLAHEWRADVKLMAKADSTSKGLALIAPLQRRIEIALDGHIFGYDRDTLASVVLDTLAKAGLRLAVAESCTGGQLSAALTAVAGSSRSFVGGVVAYENKMKIEQLGVPAEVLERSGAVSEEAARAMAEGARMKLGAEIAVATTGIAGPQGGSSEKPVGLVWFAVAGAEGTIVRRIDFPGDRAAIQGRATTAALGMLWRYLQAREPNRTPAS
jgi:nicotinamide-nucleotide amidase